MMLFDILETMRLKGYSDIIDADTCRRIIDDVENMDNDALAARYRQAVRDWLLTPGEGPERYNGELVDIYAILCLTRCVVLFPFLDL